MKRRELQRIALLACIMLVILAGAAGLWVRKEQRQYTLDRRFIEAVCKGDAKQAIALVNAGADPNIRYTPTPVPTLFELLKQLLHRSPLPTNDSPTALAIACGGGYAECGYYLFGQDAPQLVQAMLRHGAKVNARDNYGRTPLLWAANADYPNTVSVLLEHGADVNAQDTGKWTPLMLAVQIHDTLDASNIVHQLLKHGANVNAKDMFGGTALYWTVQASESPADHGAAKAVMRQLVAYGGNPNIANNEGYTPIKLLQLEKRSDLVALMTKTPSNSSAPKQTLPPSGKR